MVVKLKSIFKSLDQAFDKRNNKDVEEMLRKLAGYTRRELEEEIETMSSADWMFLDGKLIGLDDCEDRNINLTKELILDIFSMID